MFTMINSIYKHFTILVNLALYFIFTIYYWDAKICLKLLYLLICLIWLGVNNYVLKFNNALLWMIWLLLITDYWLSITYWQTDDSQTLIDGF